MRGRTPLLISLFRDVLCLFPERHFPFAIDSFRGAREQKDKTLDSDPFDFWSLTTRRQEDLIPEKGNMVNKAYLLGLLGKILSFLRIHCPIPITN